MKGCLRHFSLFNCCTGLLTIIFLYDKFKLIALFLSKGILFAISRYQLLAVSRQATLRVILILVALPNAFVDRLVLTPNRVIILTLCTSTKTLMSTLQRPNWPRPGKRVAMMTKKGKDNLPLLSFVGKFGVFQSKCSAFSPLLQFAHWQMRSPHW